jgi:hypothetical protein
MIIKMMIEMVMDNVIMLMDILMIIIQMAETPILEMLIMVIYGNGDKEEYGHDKEDCDNDANDREYGDNNFNDEDDNGDSCFSINI